jgi:hypothetical protein
MWILMPWGKELTALNLVSENTQTVYLLSVPVKPHARKPTIFKLGVMYVSRAIMMS